MNIGDAKWGCSNNPIRTRKFNRTATSLDNFDADMSA